MPDHAPRSPVLAALALAAALATPPRTLAVAAASSVKPALVGLAAAFEAAHPGVRVAVTSGASGVLYAQIAQGAPFDVLFSADRETPDRLVADGLAAPGDEAVYARGALVVWAPRGGPPLDLEARGVAALADPAVRRVAIANPRVAPYGRAAEAALRWAGAWDAVAPKLVRGENVAQAAQFAESGAADAALVPRALALLPALRGGRAVAIPPEAHPPLDHALVVLRGARAPDLARAFASFARGEKGRAILAKAGYAPP